MNRFLFSIAAFVSLFATGCCCDNLCNCFNPCGRSCCSSPCASPCASPCGTGACGTPTGFAAPINGTAYAPSGVPLTSNAGIVNGPILTTAAAMPQESLPTY